MKQRISALIFCLAVDVCTLTVIPHVSISAPITQVVGANVDCTEAVCGLRLPFFELLCGGVNCPSAFATQDEAAFYGVNGRTLIRSTNGTAWNTFTTNPPGVATSDYTVGVTSTGAVLVAFTVNPATCMIYRSTDQTSTWVQVYIQANQQCGGGGSTTSVMKCVSQTCVLPYTVFPTNFATILVTVNDGVNWNQDTSIFGAVAVSPLVYYSTYWDGTNGVAAFSDGFGSLKGVFSTTAGLGNWTAGAWVSGVDPSSCFAATSNPNFNAVLALCNFSAFTMNNPKVDLDGDLLNAANLTAIATTAYYGGRQYIAGPVSAGTCNFYRNGGGAGTVYTQYISAVGGCNTTAFLNAVYGAVADMFVVNDKIYGTVGATGANARAYRLRP